MVGKQGGTYRGIYGFGVHPGFRLSCLPRIKESGDDSRREPQQQQMHKTPERVGECGGPVQAAGGLLQASRGTTQPCKDTRAFNGTSLVSTA